MNSDFRNVSNEINESGETTASSSLISSSHPTNIPI